MFSRLFVVSAALPVLAGCATVYPQTGSTDPGFGEALKYDMAIQIIDPDPVYSAEGSQPGDHGEKGAEAVKRYRTGQVKEVQVQDTTSGGSGSGPR